MCSLSSVSFQEVIFEWQMVSRCWWIRVMSRLWGQCKRWLCERENSEGVGQSFFTTLPPKFSFAIPSEFALHSIIWMPGTGCQVSRYTVLQFPSKINIPNASRNGKLVCKSTTWKSLYIYLFISIPHLWYLSSHETNDMMSCLVLWFRTCYINVYCMIFNNYNFFVIVQVVMAQNALSLKMFVSNVNFKTELSF